MNFNTASVSGYFSFGANVVTVINFLWPFLLGSLTSVGIVKFFFRKEIRLFRNIHRKIILLRTGSATLETEYELLRKNGLFSAPDRVIEIKDGTKVISTLDKFSVFVLGYDPKYKYYRELIDKAITSNIPTVVLAKPGEIIPEHMAIFQNHCYFEMCNTPARLLTVIFNLCMITPYDKNRI